MKSTRRPGMAARRRTCASFTSVVGQTSGQCVKPKNTSVGAPARSWREKAPGGVGQLKVVDGLRLRQPGAACQLRGSPIKFAGDPEPGNAGAQSGSNEQPADTEQGHR